MIRVLLIDDVPQILRAWGSALDRAGYATYRASSRLEAEQLLSALAARGEPLDVVLLDLQLGGDDGAELLPLISELHPTAAVAVVSGNLDAERSLEVGPHCDLTVPKPVREQTLLRLVGELAGKRGSGLLAFAARFKLSPRERQVLEAAYQGAGSKQIAGRLGISKATVETHWQRIFAKSGLRSQRDVMAAISKLARLGAAPAA